MHVQRQNVNQNVFDPGFMSFGVFFDNTFRDNFSANFRSNFNGNYQNEVRRVIQSNRQDGLRRSNPPANEESLNSLKRFLLSEKYCKKKENGEIELPSCSICLSDVEMREETAMIPCGHMFHWSCLSDWLNRQNTCPLCRFEVKK